MNNQTAKEILSAYRPGGEDAQDDNFREALAHCERDPQMKAWLADQLSFDRQAAEALQSIRGPDAGKQSILATLPFDSRKGRRSRYPRWLGISGLGMAAAILAGFLLFSVLAPHKDGHQTPDRLALAPLADAAKPFDLESGEFQTLVSWLEKAGAPIPQSLPDALREAEAVGCRVFDTTGFGTISLICFHVDGQIVHLFAFQKDSPHLSLPSPGQWWEEGGWNFVTLNQGNGPLVIATQTEPDSFSLYS